MHIPPGEATLHHCTHAQFRSKKSAEDGKNRKMSKKKSISKLSLGDKSPIIHQTTNWRLDNAVEPTHIIKNTFLIPLHFKQSEMHSNKQLS